jgi:hypothetical protein
MTRGRPEPAARNKDDGRYKAEKKSGCFIATAVYGDYEAPEVVTLRRWRDDELLRAPMGRAAVWVYYRVSPPVAWVMKQSPWLSARTRVLLDAFIRRNC